MGEGFAAFHREAVALCVATGLGKGSRGVMRRRRSDDAPPCLLLRAPHLLPRPGPCDVPLTHPAPQVIDDPGHTKILLVMTLAEGGPVLTRASLEAGRRLPEAEARAAFHGMAKVRVV